MMSFLLAAPPFLWLALFIVFAVFEGISVALTSVWFAVGALVALFVSFLVPVLWIQALVFALVSLVSLLLMRPLAKKMMQPKGKVPTNADRVLHRVGVVTETIDNLAATGQVQVAGQVWSARSAEDGRIFAGEEVRVLSIEGVKLVVEPVAVAAPRE